jgi:hypothetical protein
MSDERIGYSTGDRLFHLPPISGSGDLDCTQIQVANPDSSSGGKIPLMSPQFLE